MYLWTNGWSSRPSTIYLVIDTSFKSYAVFCESHQAYYSFFQQYRFIKCDNQESRSCEPFVFQRLCKSGLRLKSQVLFFRQKSGAWGTSFHRRGWWQTNTRQTKLLSGLFPWVSETDPSSSTCNNIGIGAILFQLRDENVSLHTIAARYHERRYCVTRRELLAVVTLVQHYWPYLACGYFTLRTDLGSLTWLRNFKEPKGQLAR